MRQTLEGTGVVLLVLGLVAWYAGGGAGRRRSGRTGVVV